MDSSTPEHPASPRPGEPRPAAAPLPPSLDELFRRSVARQPHVPALVDSPDKRRITTDAPIALTYAEADAAIATLATQFLAAGLPTGSILAVQMPNTVEFYLTVMAALRAGLVVAVLPQLFRQAELAAALNRTSARAIVTCATIDGVNHADLAMTAAVEAFSIRSVFGFGAALPEGMIPLDPNAPVDKAVRLPTPDPRRTCMISFDVTPEGPRAIPRTQLQLTAGGLAVYLESRIDQGGTVLAALQPSSFAGLSASLVPWLLSGGTLVLHHPFDDTVLLRQLQEEGCTALVAPAPLLHRLAEAGALEPASGLRQCIGLWRTPEQVESSADWPRPTSSFTDVYLFGEAGLFAARRDDTGAPAALRAGSYTVPRDGSGSVAGEILISARGTLGLRGPMVPVNAFRPLTVEPQGLTATAPPPDYVDTGYAARNDRATGALHITAPPTGILAVGGYRFMANDLQEWAKRLSQGAMLTALPDRLSGYRLAGRASDNARAREALAGLGLNPLMVEAFRDRPVADAAAT